MHNYIYKKNSYEANIPINKIFFDNAMWLYVKKNCLDIINSQLPTALPKSIPPTVGKLQQWRLDKIQEAYNNGNENKIRNIDVVEHIKKNGEKSGHYIVIDGRHRVVKAICNKKTTINAEFNSIFNS